MTRSNAETIARLLSAGGHPGGTDAGRTRPAVWIKQWKEQGMPEVFDGGVRRRSRLRVT